MQQDIRALPALGRRIAQVALEQDNIRTGVLEISKPQSGGR